MSDKAVSNTSKKALWKYILFFYDWSIFEKSLLGINVIVSVIFYILAIVSPSHFSAYTPDKIHLNFLKNTDARIILDTLGLITSFINTCCLLLISKGRISNFIWGLFAVSFLGFLSFICSNTGTWIVNWVIQIPMNILGMIMWKRMSKTKTTIESRNLNWTWRGISIFTIAALTTGFYFLFNDNTVRDFWYEDPTLNKNLWYILLDACILAITIVAMFLLTFGYAEQWYLWIFCDVVYVIMFSWQGNAQLSITWIVGLINSCYGLYLWRFKEKTK